MSPRVFLSHKKCDRLWTKTLAEHLRSAGIEVFFDEDMSIEAFWRSELDSQAASTKQLDHYFVLVATPESVASKEVFREVEHALGASAGERCFTLLYRETPMPAGWSLKQLGRIGEPSQYDAVVRDLVQVVGGKAALSRLPRNLANPNYNEAWRIPCDLRRKVLELLKGRCLTKGEYRGLQDVIGTKRERVPERYREFIETDSLLLASVALVHSMSEALDPYAQVVSKLESICRELLGRDDEDAAWLALIREIRVRAASDSWGGSPFGPYLARVRAETNTLLLEHLRPGIAPQEDGEEEQVERLLEDVYVELDLKRRQGAPAPGDEFVDALEQVLEAQSQGTPGILRLWPAAIAPSLGDWLLHRLVFRTPDRWHVQTILADRNIAATLRGEMEFDREVLAEIQARLEYALGTTPRSVLLVTGYSDDDSGREEREHVLQHFRSRLPLAHILDLDARESVALHELLELRPDLHPGLSGRYILRGHPGTGKSTALRCFAYRSAKLEQPSFVPISFSLPDLAAERCTLKADLQKRYPDPEVLTPLLAALEAQGRGLALLFDGLDEVAKSKDRQWIEDLLRSFATEYPEARIVVATRKIGYRAFAPSTFVELDLQPLDGTRQRQLLTKWFRSSPKRITDPEVLADAVLQKLERPAFAELRTVPLLLSFVAMLFEDDPGFELERSRSALFRKILDYLQQGRTRRAPHALGCFRDSRRALQSLAVHGTLRDGEELVLADYEQELLRHWFTGALGELPSAYPGPTGASDWLKAQSERAGILIGASDSRARWAFWHRTLREALVAEAMHGRAPGLAGELDPDAIAAKIQGHEAQWAEPFAFFIGGSDCGDEWLRRLSRRNHALALRALGSLEQVDAAVAEEVLGHDELDTDERCQKVLALPEQVADAQACARLLGQLAAPCEDTQVLWHLDRALDLLLAREPGAIDEVRRARARFFSAPCFGPRIDPNDLRVPGHPAHSYWCRVGAGTTFWMGSPEDQYGYQREEGPQVMIRFERDYEIAAIPVTNSQYRQFRLDHPFAVGHFDHPAVLLSWFDAAMYCRWIGARLPSEAEWECAARAGTTTRYWSGDAEEDLAKVGWFDKNAGREAHRVATKLSNALGLFDVHGNVRNWCADAWFGRHEGAISVGLPREGDGVSRRVVRGGSFWHESKRCRSASRRAWAPGDCYDGLGFRPARFARP